MRCRRDRIGKRRRYVRRRWVGTLLGLGLCGTLGAGVYALWSSADQPKQADTQPSPSTAVVKPSEKGGQLLA